MRLFTYGVAAAILAFAGGCGPKHTPAHEITDLTLKAPNGITLHASLFQAMDGHPPGILLVADAKRDRHVWDGVAERLRAEQCMALTVELPRGCEGFAESDWDQVRDALALAKKTLREHGADPENLAVAGEGLAASLALHYALQDPGIQAVALISPDVEYRSMETASAMARLKERPLLLMAAEGDAVSAARAASLKTSSKGFCELRMYPGTAHGADLFAVSDHAVEQFLQWVSLTVGRKNSEGEGGDGQHHQPAHQLGQ